MKIHELNLTSTKDRKRVGRGIGSGYGKTAGRGTKGQNARTGGGVRPGFEGGQNPLAKRLPKKRGFASLNRTHYQVVNLAGLSKLRDGSTAGPEQLVEHGLVKKADAPIKLLAGGAIEKKLTLKVHAASAAAKAAVEAAGGTLELLGLPKATPKKATRPKVDETPAEAKGGEA
jgi:large subunit ribosomal protein L15